MNPYAEWAQLIALLLSIGVAVVVGIIALGGRAAVRHLAEMLALIALGAGLWYGLYRLVLAFHPLSRLWS